MPNDTKGLTITKLNTIVRESLGTTQLFLDDVRIPKANIIGEVGEGWTYIGEHLELERLSLAASYVGNARTALDDTIRYTKDRKQFGRSLSSFQVLKHRMAENECEVEAARLLIYAAAAKMARGERAIKEVSMAKVFAADVLFKVAFNGMQALGGYASCPRWTWSATSAKPSTRMVGGGTRRSSAASSPRRWGCSPDWRRCGMPLVVAGHTAPVARRIDPSPSTYDPPLRGACRPAGVHQGG